MAADSLFYHLLFIFVYCGNKKMLQRHKGRNYEGFQPRPSTFLIRYFCQEKTAFRCRGTKRAIEVSAECKDGKINFRVSSDSLLSAILITSCFQMNSRFITAGVAFNYGCKGWKNMQIDPLDNGNSLRSLENWGRDFEFDSLSFFIFSQLGKRCKLKEPIDRRRERNEAN